MNQNSELETDMIQMNDNTMSAFEPILSNAQLIGLIFNLGALFHFLLVVISLTFIETKPCSDPGMSIGLLSIGLLSIGLRVR
jgi:hypothetical protein